MKAKRARSDVPAATYVRRDNRLCHTGSRTPLDQPTAWWDWLDHVAYMSA